MTRPLVLVTNDDGITSPGLAAAVEAVLPLGDVLVAAPARQQTSMGRAFPRLPGGGVITATKVQAGGTDVPAWAIDASPAATVCHAVLELAPRRPVLCVSGVNYGENVGTTLTASGTVGAALQADALGIPAVAISLECPPELQPAEQLDPLDHTASVEVLRSIAAQLLAGDRPAEVSMLNVNVPAGAGPETEVRVTRQSRQGYYVPLAPAARDLSRPWELRYDVEIDLESLEPDSDIWALCVDRVVSVTPLTWSMTAPAVFALRPPGPRTS